MLKILKRVLPLAFVLLVLLLQVNVAVAGGASSGAGPGGESTRLAAVDSTVENGAIMP